MLLILQWPGEKGKAKAGLCRFRRGVTVSHPHGSLPEKCATGLTSSFGQPQNRQVHALSDVAAFVVVFAAGEVLAVVVGLPNER